MRFYKVGGSVHFFTSLEQPCWGSGLGTWVLTLLRAPLCPGRGGGWTGRTCTGRSCTCAGRQRTLRLLQQPEQRCTSTHGGHTRKLALVRSSRRREISNTSVRVLHSAIMAGSAAARGPAGRGAASGGSCLSPCPAGERAAPPAALLGPGCLSHLLQAQGRLWPWRLPGEGGDLVGGAAQIASGQRWPMPGLLWFFTDRETEAPSTNPPDATDGGSCARAQLCQPRHIYSVLESASGQRASG